jgi:hypothetical protein
MISHLSDFHLKLSQRMMSMTQLTPTPTNQPTPIHRFNDQTKTLGVLECMKQFSLFSLKTLINTLFKDEDSRIKNTRNIFLADGGHLDIMDFWWTHQRDDNFSEWVVKKASEVCAKEAENLSNRSLRGPFSEDAKFLWVSATQVDVPMLNDFRLAELTSRYDCITPHLQVILKAVIGKEGKERKSGSRDPHAVCIMIVFLFESKLMVYWYLGQNHDNLNGFELAKPAP